MFADIMCSYLDVYLLFVWSINELKKLTHCKTDVYNNGYVVCTGVQKCMMDS